MHACSVLWLTHACMHSKYLCNTRMHAHLATHICMREISSKTAIHLRVDHMVVFELSKAVGLRPRSHVCSMLSLLFYLDSKNVYQ